MTQRYKKNFGKPKMTAIIYKSINISPNVYFNVINFFRGYFNSLCLTLPPYTSKIIFVLTNLNLIKNLRVHWQRHPPKSIQLTTVNSLLLILTLICLKKSQLLDFWISEIKVHLYHIWPPPPHKRKLATALQWMFNGNSNFKINQILHLTRKISAH